jgi:Ni/Co efflux regulator RcnB
MKRFLVAAAALTLLAGAAQTASAQPGYDHREPQGSDRHDQGGPPHDWRRGGRIERNDWNRGQVVDYRRYRLRAPPRGYQWRRVDNNYVLAAVAGGVIADIIASGR